MKIKTVLLGLLVSSLFSMTAFADYQTQWNCAVTEEEEIYEPSYLVELDEESGKYLVKYKLYDSDRSPRVFRDFVSAEVEGDEMVIIVEDRPYNGTVHTLTIRMALSPSTLESSTVWLGSTLLKITSRRDPASHGMTFDHPVACTPSPEFSTPR